MNMQLDKKKIRFPITEINILVILDLRYTLKRLLISQPFGIAGALRWDISLQPSVRAIKPHVYQNIWPLRSPDKLSSK